MKLIVNNKPEEYSLEHLNQLMQALDLLESKGIAVAVNNKVVPKTNWNTFQLNENDTITIIRATQGG
jgi:sulfur carrier protein